MAKDGSFNKGSNFKSDMKSGFEDKARAMEREGFGGRISPTGYSETLVGMDDIDRLRRIKFNRQVNDGR